MESVSNKTLINSENLDDFYHIFKQGHVGPLLSYFSDDIVFIMNGRKTGTIPFAGKYQGILELGKFLTRYFQSMEIIEFQRQYDLFDNEGSLKVKKIASYYNLQARIKSTGKIFDNEYALAIHLNDEGKIKYCRIFYNTHLIYLAFQKGGESFLSDEKGTGNNSMLYDIDFKPDEIVPDLYSLMFGPEVSTKEKVFLFDLIIFALKFLLHNIFRSPLFWIKVIKNLRLFKTLHNTNLLLKFYSDDMLHMIKGGETEVDLCGTYHGKMGLVDFGTRLFIELDYRNIPPMLDCIIDGNRCAVHMPETFVNRKTGTIGIVHMLHMWRFNKEGKVIEFKSYNDTYEIVNAYIYKNL